MDRIDKAFSKFDRADFVPEDMRKFAHSDVALPIGYSQTISQPTTVALMLEWLDAQLGDIVLDVGSGSGWSAALLSYIVGPKGRVYAVERIPELVEFGRDNAENAGVRNASFHQAIDGYGLPEHGPFDRILVSAAADRLPKSLIKQLKPGGKLVIPVHYDILEVTKNKSGQVKSKAHPAFVFVPLL